MSFQATTEGKPEGHHNNKEVVYEWYVQGNICAALFFGYKVRSTAGASVVHVCVHVCVCVCVCVRACVLILSSFNS